MRRAMHILCRILMLTLFMTNGLMMHARVFVSAPKYAVGGSPELIYSSDFNGDGRSDLAVMRNGAVSILLARAGGSFPDYRELFVTTGSLAMGDFNGDGKADLAASGVGVITIFVGQGDGTFLLVGSVPANSPSSIVAADMNNDGKLDLVTAIASRQTQGVSVLLGNGDGTFQAGIDDLFNGSPVEIQIGDFNSDGKADVVALIGFAYAKTTVRVLLGNGDGTLQPAVDSLVGDTTYTAALADYDEDGHLDVAVEGRLTNQAFVLFGTGDGHLRGTRSYPTGLGPRAVVTADFNGDGKPDLATSNYDDSSVSVLLGRGNGGFQDHSDFGTGYNPFVITVGDFNGDGRADLATIGSEACCSPSTVTVLLNGGGGILQSSRFFDTALNGSNTVATGDLNGDGSPDLVVGSEIAHFLSVLIGNGDATFAVPHLFAVAQVPKAVAIGDFNGDGKLDVVCTISVSGGVTEVSVLLGNGDGTLQAPIDNPVPHYPGALAVGDLNADGVLDVVVGEGSAWPAPGDIAILIGNGDGTFQPAQIYDTGGIGASPVPVIADVNGDGKLDLLTSNGNMLGVLLGRGDGTFRSRIESNAGTELFPVATGDLNLDGNLDVVSAGSSGGAGGKVGTMLGNGDGTFQPLVKYGADRGPHRPSVADFNQDGYPDVVVTNGYGSLSAFLNNGDGTLQGHTDYIVGSYAEQNAAADFNGDGYPDLVVANTGAGGGHNVTVLLNKGAR